MLTESFLRYQTTISERLKFKWEEKIIFYRGLVGFQLLPAPKFRLFDILIRISITALIYPSKTFFPFLYKKQIIFSINYCVFILFKSWKNWKFVIEWCFMTWKGYWIEKPIRLYGIEAYVLCCTCICQTKSNNKFIHSVICNNSIHFWKISLIISK